MRVNVPVEDEPPTTVLGLKVTDAREAAVTVRLVFRVTP